MTGRGTATLLKRSIRPAAIAAVLLVSWPIMLATHELGHVLHANASGGRVIRVAVPLLGFSHTEVSPNPHPAFVAWGGVLWGCLLPLAAWGMGAALRRPRAWAIGLFAGFCLIANGAYLAAAIVLPVGDAQDLLRLGVPRWTLVAAGLAMFAGGLAIGHVADPRRAGLRTSPSAAPPA